MLLLIGVSGASLWAAPQLRLARAAVGPLDIAAGLDGATVTVEAWNAGDGALALTATSAEGWLSPAVGAPRPCQSRGGVCLPIEIGLQTAGLERGVHTGMVDIADPRALDAPQSITVTVQIGGGVPDKVNLYIPPMGSDGFEFRTSSRLAVKTSTQSGGDWLSLALDGGGSFGFAMPYRVSGRDGRGLPSGVYKGAIQVTASAFAPDIKTVPVTLHVTAKPIAALSSDRVALRAVAGGLPEAQVLALRNRGLGKLSVSAVSVATTSGGSWLAAEAGAGSLKIEAAGKDLAPGLYRGTVTLESNAVNSPQTIPVRLEVVAQGPPRAAYRGVVNNATFSPDEPIPQGGIAAVFGEQLSSQPPSVGSKLPLVRELGGVKVLVNGQETPLYYSSNHQINFQMPYEIPAGEARVQVVRDSQPGNIVTVAVAGASPRILTFLGRYAIALHTDNALAVPPAPGVFARRAAPGDVLVLYAIGFGPTVPPVRSGEAAPLEPLARVAPAPRLFLGGGLLPVEVAPSFVGLSPGSVGLYQVNFAIPAGAPKGDHVPLVIRGPGYTTNEAEIAIR